MQWNPAVLEEAELLVANMGSNSLTLREVLLNLAFKSLFPKEVIPLVLPNKLFDYMGE